MTCLRLGLNISCEAGIVAVFAIRRRFLPQFIAVQSDREHVKILRLSQLTSTVF